MYYINYSYNKIEHSGLFVNWVDKKKKIGRIISYGGENRKESPKYNNFDLKSVYTIIRGKNSTGNNNNTTNDTNNDKGKGTFKGKLCPKSLILTQNLNAPRPGQRYIRNGRYNRYTRGIVKEAHILQKHLNRLGFNAGPVDGIIGPKTRAAILRMQRYLGTVADGYVGPITRRLINHSCE